MGYLANKVVFGTITHLRNCSIAEWSLHEDMNDSRLCFESAFKKLTMGKEGFSSLALPGTGGLLWPDKLRWLLIDGNKVPTSNTLSLKRVRTRANHKTVITTVFIKEYPEPKNAFWVYGLLPGNRPFLGKNFRDFASRFFVQDSTRLSVSEERHPGELLDLMKKLTFRSMIDAKDGKQAAKAPT